MTGGPGSSRSGSSGSGTSAGRVDRLVVPARFNGPPASGNGGYVAGRLAQAYARLTAAPPEAPVTVTLRQPPPLDVGLDVSVDESGRLAATLGGAVIATAEAGHLATDPVDPVDAEAARAGEQRYAGLRAHPFPTCFVCGPDRPAHDGMALAPGRTSADPTDPVACTWTPDDSLRAAGGPSDVIAQEFVWAALDCPSGWASDLEARPMVLGRITAAVDAQPAAGDHCIVVARLLGEDGRKTLTASTAYDPDGRVLGRAEATWIALA